MSCVKRYFCDVCGKELDDEIDFIQLDVLDYFACMKGGSVTIEADLCDGCLDILQHDIIDLIISRVKPSKE